MLGYLYKRVIELCDFITESQYKQIKLRNSWILYEDHQKTDVHYNSLNGEGNFNWRFVFRVTYSRGEHLMIVRKKLSVLAKDESEQALPCKLNLQVWDSDHFSPDDFLGKTNIPFHYRTSKASILYPPKLFFSSTRIKCCLDIALASQN